MNWKIFCLYFQPAKSVLWSAVLSSSLGQNTDYSTQDWQGNQGKKTRKQNVAFFVGGGIA